MSNGAWSSDCAAVMSMVSRRFAQLIDAETDARRWAERFDRDTCLKPPISLVCARLGRRKSEAAGPRRDKTTCGTLDVAAEGGVIEAQMADRSDQAAIVTGSSRGICRAIARAPSGEARRSASTMQPARRRQKQPPPKLRRPGGRVIAIQAGVTDADAVGRMVVRTEVGLGPVGIVVNNAGVSCHA
jgi:hypothetical protein